MIRQTAEAAFAGAPLLTEGLYEQYPSILDSKGALLLHQSTTLHRSAEHYPEGFEEWHTGRANYVCLASSIDEVIRRENEGIVCGGDSDDTDAYIPGWYTKRCTAERVALEALVSQVAEISKAIADGVIPQYYGDHPFEEFQAMTFIDHQSYNEAAAGIAARWKYLLDGGARLAIVSGVVANNEKIANPERYRQRRIKSDEYLLERVLWHFSEGELRRYAGQFVLDISTLPKEPEDGVRVIFLDDWIISGEQMYSATRSVLSRYPLYQDRSEVQLIAASSKNLDEGFLTMAVDYESIGVSMHHIPVSAYFRAHDTPRVSYGAIISGSHSAVDYAFRLPISTLSAGLRSSGYLKGLEDSVLLDVQRPYRVPGVSRESLHQTQLLKQYIKELTGVEK